MKYCKPELSFSFLHHMSEANASYLEWNGKCFITKLLHLKRIHFYEARQSAYEAFCGGMPQNMKHRRCGMKQSLFRLHVFLPLIKAKKWRLEIFIFPRHSETLFELENSEFSCEIKFWKSLHFYSEKLRITSRVSSRLQPNWDNDSLNNLYFNIYQKIWIQEISIQIIDNKIELNMKSATIRKKASAKIFCMVGQIWHYYCCISR